jgi:hypothetical protein
MNSQWSQFVGIIKKGIVMDQEHRLQMVEGRISNMEKTLSIAVDCLQRVVSLEERTSNSKESIGRAFEENTELKKEVHEQGNEINQLKIAIIPLQDTTAVWKTVQKIGITVVITALFALIIVKK